MSGLDAVRAFGTDQVEYRPLDPGLSVLDKPRADFFGSVVIRRSQSCGDVTMLNNIVYEIFGRA